MAGYEGYTHRCGYCGTKGDPGRCVVCGSGMDNEDKVIEGANHPHLIRRWLASRDHAWERVAAMRTELHHRHMEDFREGRNIKRFDGLPDEFELLQRAGDKAQPLQGDLPDAP